MRFTFVLVGWPGSVHDTRVFNDARYRFGDKFPKPPPNKFYVVDSGYPNRPGYLSPYKGLTYHFQEYRDLEEKRNTSISPILHLEMSSRGVLES